LRFVAGSATMARGTLFTLFVVRAVYLLIATDHSREVERGASQFPPSTDAGRTV